ncbi:MAG: hypothetical protein NUW01_18675 [Gemmatimonadaceae bacterium]|nr:hypothetical protein [Gemmatimonadaceae bacterium]
MMQATNDLRRYRRTHDPQDEPDYDLLREQWADEVVPIDAISQISRAMTDGAIEQLADTDFPAFEYRELVRMWLWDRPDVERRVHLAEYGAAFELWATFEAWTEAQR